MSSTDGLLQETLSAHCKLGNSIYILVCTVLLIMYTQEPLRITLGEKRVWKGSGQKRRCVVKEDTFMYVPILQTLAILLQNKDLRSQVCVPY